MHQVEPTSYPSTFMTICGGRIRCLRCTAKSKRTGLQCGAAAARGKQRCKWHGGRSTGPKTPEGRARIAASPTTHGSETRELRAERSQGLARIAALDRIGRAIGMFTGPKTRGPKPKASVKL